MIRKKTKSKRKPLLKWHRDGSRYKADLDAGLSLIVGRQYDMWELKLAEGFWGAHVAFFGTLRCAKQYGIRVAKRRARGEKDWWK